jgi:hypothetical protein
MNLTFQLLKKYFPELNKKIIKRERILEVFGAARIQFYEIPMEGRGVYVHDASDKTDYVFIRYSLQSLIYHETLAFEGVHALCHAPATFLERRQNLQCEIFSLVFMMPAPDLPRLNRIKGQLDAESYDFLMRRNKVKAVWRY